MTAVDSKPARVAAIASTQRYFEENMPGPIGNLAAGLLLDSFLEDVGPAIYNQTIATHRRVCRQRVIDLNGEIYVDEFQYWPRADSKRKSRR